MADSRAIGIFDSGVGGLTVAKAIHNLMPDENLIYFGDTAHLPYGDKSDEAIVHFSKGIASYLQEKHQIKALLIACNSASAVAYNPLKSYLPESFPVYNVIDPVAAEIALTKPNSVVGVIGTRATINSGSYTQKIRTLEPSIDVSTLRTPLLVPLIEEGLAESKIAHETLSYYLEQPELGDIDSLVLGCTHYPHIQKKVEELSDGRFEVINSPEIVAARVLKDLAARDLKNDSSHQGKLEFYVSDYTAVFENIAQIMFGSNITLVEENIWE